MSKPTAVPTETPATVEVSADDVYTALVAEEAALRARLAAIQKAKPAQSAAAKAQIETTRFEIFKVRAEIEPLEEENKRLIAVHLTLTGLSKVKFSEEERTKFVTRMQIEARAARK